VIWTERHNAAFYWESFATLKSSKNALRAYDSGSLQPDNEDIELVAMLAKEGFEDATQAYGPAMTAAHVAEGEYAYLSSQDSCVLVEGQSLKEASGGQWLKAGLKGYMDPESVPGNRDYTAKLVVELYDENGKRKRFRSIQISPHLGNNSGSIWTSGYPGVWGEASFFIKLPNKVKNGWTAKVYVNNWPKQLVYLDDFKLEIYQNK
jgi:hypothetical protein